MACTTCKKTKCGCEDQGLTTPVNCATNTPECPTPEPCSETFSSDCVVYTGDTIVDLGIFKGDRLSEIIQLITIMLTNPGCMTPGSSCFSVLNVRSTLITGTTIKIAWSGVSTATSYQVEYKLATAVSWTLNPVVPITSPTADTIGGLTLNSDYHIRVKATCASGSCYSVTILVRTKTT